MHFNSITKQRCKSNIAKAVIIDFGLGWTPTINKIMFSIKTKMGKPSFICKNNT